MCYNLSIMRELPKQIKRRAEIKDGYVIFKKQSPCTPFHYHDFYELEFISSGSAVVTINSEKYNLTKGDAYLLRPTDLHEFSAVGETQIYSISFMPERVNAKIMDDFTMKAGYLLTSLSNKDSQLFEGLLAKTTILTKQNRQKEVVSAVLDILISTLLNYAESAKTLDYEDSIYEAIKYVNNNFTKDPTLDEVAKVAGFGVTYFCRKFKKVTGKTYTQYLSEIKIDFAARLIARSNTAITEICFISGFNSISQFIREFKRIMGISPSAYRKNVKQPKTSAK